MHRSVRPSPGAATRTRALGSPAFASVTTSPLAALREFLLGFARMASTPDEMANHASSRWTSPTPTCAD